MDKLQAIRTFRRVAQAHSFAAAARHLDLAPSVVTRLVADLEAQLGARLLHRTTRRVDLTPAGETYLRAVHALVDQLDEADAEVISLNSRPRGQLRIAGVPALMRAQVVPLLGAFRARYPEVGVRLSPLPAPMEPDEAADLSLMVVGTSTLADNCVTRRLATASAMLCAAPAWVERCGWTDRPNELPLDQLLIPSSADVPRPFHLRPPASAADVEAVRCQVLPPAIHSADAELVLASALAGLGIGGLLSFSAAGPLARGELVRLFPDWQIGSWSVVAVLPSNRYLPSRTSAFLDFLAEAWGDSSKDPWSPPAARRLPGNAVIAPP